MKRWILAIFCVFGTLAADQKLTLPKEEAMQGLCMGTFYVSGDDVPSLQYVHFEQPRLEKGEGEHDYTLHRCSELTCYRGDETAQIELDGETIDLLAEPGKQVLLQRRPYTPTEEQLAAYQLREFAESRFFSVQSLFQFEERLKDYRVDPKDPLTRFIGAVLTREAELTEDETGSRLKISDQHIELDPVELDLDSCDLSDYPQVLREFFEGEGSFIAGNAYGGASRTVTHQTGQIECNTSVRLDIDILNAERELIRSIVVDWGLVWTFEEGLALD